MQDVAANLVAERTDEWHPGRGGVGQPPWEAAKPVAVHPGSLRRPKDPKYKGDPADRWVCCGGAGLPNRLLPRRLLPRRGGARPPPRCVAESGLGSKCSGL